MLRKALAPPRETLAPLACDPGEIWHKVCDRVAQHTNRAVHADNISSDPHGNQSCINGSMRHSHAGRSSGQELKVVIPQEGLSPEAFERFSVQPMDGLQRARNMRLAVEFCLAHPR